MATTGIYKITDKQNGKIYIGQSVNIEKRWTAHKNGLQNLTKIDSMIVQKGVNNFTFEIIEKCSREKLNEREIFWINHYNSFHKGYNQTTGGNSAYWTPVKLTVKQVNKIKHLLKNTNEDQISIAKKFNVSQPTIAMINTGETWKDDIHKYPIRILQKATKPTPIKNTKPTQKQLIQMIKRHKGNFTSLATELKISTTTIRRWCKSYNMSTSSLDYRPVKTKNQYSQPKPVNMIDPNNGRILQKFQSMLEAERFLNKVSGARHIKEVCEGKRKTAYGYVWNYAIFDKQ